MNVQETMEEIKHFAGLAVHFDRQGNANAAAYYYMEASRLIISASEQEELKNLQSKALEYKQRSEELLSLAAQKDTETVFEKKVSLVQIVFFHIENIFQIFLPKNLGASMEMSFYYR